MTKTQRDHHKQWRQARAAAKLRRRILTAWHQGINDGFKQMADAFAQLPQAAVDATTNMRQFISIHSKGPRK